MSDNSALQRAAAIPARLRAARENAGLSQGQVAKLMGLHRPSISELEAGNRRVSAEELARLAELYDVKVAWVLGETPERVASDDPKLQLAARELSKLKPDDLERLMTLIAAMKEDGDGAEG
jgi:transcriptional regulator with XRE-family HTH domain